MTDTDTENEEGTVDTQAQYKTIQQLFDYHVHNAIEFTALKAATDFSDLKVLIVNDAEQVGYVEPLLGIETLEIQNQDEPAIFPKTNNEHTQEILLNPETYKQKWFVFRN